MPSELPKTPHETYQSLLNGSRSNTHMPIVGHEGAYLAVPSRPWITWRGVLVFISGAIFVALIMGYGGPK